MSRLEIGEMYSITASIMIGKLDGICRAQRVYVVQLAGLERVTTPDYESQKLPMQQQLARSRAESLMRGWFSPDRIRSRCAYQAGS